MMNTLSQLRNSDEVFISNASAQISTNMIRKSVKMCHLSRAWRRKSLYWAIWQHFATSMRLWQSFICCATWLVWYLGAWQRHCDKERQKISVVACEVLVVLTNTWLKNKKRICLIFAAEMHCWFTFSTSFCPSSLATKQRWYLATLRLLQWSRFQRIDSAHRHCGLRAGCDAE